LKYSIKVISPFPIVEEPVVIETRTLPIIETKPLPIVEEAAQKPTTWAELAALLKEQYGKPALT